MRGRRRFSLTCSLVSPPRSAGFRFRTKGLDMKRSRFSDEQIIGVLREHEAGAKVSELCRKYGMSSATLAAARADRIARACCDFGRDRRLAHLARLAHRTVDRHMRHDLP